MIFRIQLARMISIPLRRELKQIGEEEIGVLKEHIQLLKVMKYVHPRLMKNQRELIENLK